MTKLPDFVQSLQGRDIGQIRIIADLWGVEIELQEFQETVQKLKDQVFSIELVFEVVETLPIGAENALREIQRYQGVMQWALFTRRFGNVREMGPARRDRERPYIKENASDAEALWYRGLIGRAFFDTPDGAAEFAYIPEDILQLLPPIELELSPIISRPATNGECANKILACDLILDNACTLLAALRIGLNLDEAEKYFITNSVFFGNHNFPLELSATKLYPLLKCAGLINDYGSVDSEATRKFLEARRSEALVLMVQAWLDCQEFNDLRQIPGLIFEGEWKNDPKKTRKFIIEVLKNLSQGKWHTVEWPEPVYWSLHAFIENLREYYPDFQRPAGDYDSWFIRDEITGEYLRGFENWDRVDGALVNFIITGPMHWLGLIDLGCEPTQSATQTPMVTAFRFSKWATALLANSGPLGLSQEDEIPVVRSDGRVRIQPHSSRVMRYQFARFCEWEGFERGFFRYRITPFSLERAASQGLKVHHLLKLFNLYLKDTPPNLVTALTRWSSHGSEIKIRNVTILHVNRSEILKEIRNSKARKYLGEVLGPTAVVVNPGKWTHVLGVLAELGYLGEIKQ